MKCMSSKLSTKSIAIISVVVAIAVVGMGLPIGGYITSGSDNKDANVKVNGTYKLLETNDLSENAAARKAHSVHGDAKAVFISPHSKKGVVTIAVSNDAEDLRGYDELMAMPKTIEKGSKPAFFPTTNTKNSVDLPVADLPNLKVESPSGFFRGIGRCLFSGNASTLQSFASEFKSACKEVADSTPEKQKLTYIVSKGEKILFCYYTLSKDKNSKETHAMKVKQFTFTQIDAKAPAPKPEDADSVPFPAHKAVDIVLFEIKKPVTPQGVLAQGSPSTASAPQASTDESAPGQTNQGGKPSAAAETAKKVTEETQQKGSEGNASNTQVPPGNSPPGQTSQEVQPETTSEAPVAASETQKKVTEGNASNTEAPTGNSPPVQTSQQVQPETASKAPVVSPTTTSAPPAATSTTVPGTTASAPQALQSGTNEPPVAPGAAESNAGNNPKNKDSDVSQVTTDQDQPQAQVSDPSREPGNNDSQTGQGSK